MGIEISGKSSFSSVGKRVRRVDARDKATGRALYVDDISLRNMLFAKILRSPLPHARVTKIDTSRAERMKGVRAVLSYKDVPHHPSHMGHVHPPLAPQDRFVLDSYVRYVGHEVAAVAADSLDIAEEALGVINVEYERLPAVYDPEEAMKPSAPKLHMGEEKGIYDRTRNVANHLEIGIGDIEKEFGESYSTISETFKTSAPHHAQIEPHASIACWDPWNSKVTIWTCTQGAFHFRKTLAAALGMREGDIRVIVPYIGGGFGGKMLTGIYDSIAVLLSKKTGRPVKIALTREEMMYGTGCRPPAVLKLKLGTDKRGLFKALEADITMGTGGYALEGAGVLGYCCSILTGLYRIPAYKIRGSTVYTNQPPGLGFRGYGGAKAHWALEQMVDIAAGELKLDPIELRRMNQVRVGDSTPISQNPLKTCGLEECIDKGARLVGWKNRYDPTYRGAGNKRKGIGMATAIHVSGLGSATPPYPEVSNALLKMNQDGTFNLIAAVHDIGQGAKTAIIQIVAEELGVQIGDITLDTQIDTDVCPFDHGAFATRVTYVCGTAAKLAAADAKRQILEIAARKMDARIENLEIRDGKVYLKQNPEKTTSISEIAEYIQFHDLKDAGTIIGKGSYTAQSNSPNFAAHFAEVEVDLETGEIGILQYVAIHDVGKAINPSGVEGQIQGGVAQGLGYALIEDSMIDLETGKIRNNSFLDYKIFSSLDMPELHASFVETMDPYGPFGAKGLGETPLEPAAPAVANAVYNAIGIRMKDLPMTPEKVLALLKSSRSR